MTLFTFSSVHAQSQAGSQKPTPESIMNYLNLIGAGPVVNKNVEPFRNKALRDLNEKWSKSFPAGTQLNPRQKQLADQGLSSIRAKIQGFFDFRNLSPISIPIYQKHFTQQQMNDLIAFAKSSTGQQYFKTVYKINQEHEAAGAAKGIAFEKSIQAELDRLILTVRNTK